jgi:hypothetical protein
VRNNDEIGANTFRKLMGDHDRIFSLRKRAIEKELALAKYDQGARNIEKKLALH